MEKHKRNMIIHFNDGSKKLVTGWQGLQAGDRVRVLIGTKAARVERVWSRATGAVSLSVLPRAAPGLLPPAGYPVPL